MSDLGSPERLAAQATLTVLAAAVGHDGAGPIRSFMVASDTVAVTFEEATERLIKVSKPVRCTGSRVGDRLVIALNPIEPIVLEQRARITKLVASRRRDSHPGADLVELRVGPERVVLSLGDFEQWQEDYRLDCPGIAIGLATSHYPNFPGLDTPNLEVGRVVSVRFRDAANVQISVTRGDP